jgi:hypothetical protein
MIVVILQYNLTSAWVWRTIDGLDHMPNDKKKINRFPYNIVVQLQNILIRC